MSALKLLFPAPIIAATLALAAAGAHAQIATQTAAPDTSVDRSFDPSPKDCTGVRWSQAALDAFPSIADACQGVEQRNGKSYVKLEGSVESVKDQGKRIRVDFEGGEELSFTPAPETVLYLDGKRTPFSELRDGMRLNFYVPQDRLQAELQPDPARVAFIIFPIALPNVAVPQTQQSVAQTERENTSRSAMNSLPDTASQWPLIGGGGAALLILAAAMTMRRRSGR